MTNRMNFSILTDAKYTEAEKVDLLDEFLGWIQGVDGDVIEDSETVEIVDASEAGVTEAQRQQIITEFLQNASITTTVSLDGEDLLVK